MIVHERIKQDFKCRGTRKNKTAFLEAFSTQFEEIIVGKLWDQLLKGGYGMEILESIQKEAAQSNGAATKVFREKQQYLRNAFNWLMCQHFKISKSQLRAAYVELATDFGKLNEFIVQSANNKFIEYWQIDLNSLKEDVKNSPLIPTPTKSSMEIWKEIQVLENELLETGEKIEKMMKKEG